MLWMLLDVVAVSLVDFRFGFTFLDYFVVLLIYSSLGDENSKRIFSKACFSNECRTLVQRIENVLHSLINEL